MRAGQMHNILGNLTFFLFPLAALLLFRALGQMWLTSSRDGSGAGGRDSRGADRERYCGSPPQRFNLGLSAPCSSSPL